MNHNYGKYRRILNLTLVFLSVILTALKIVLIIKSF